MNLQLSLARGCILSTLPLQSVAYSPMALYSKGDITEDQDCDGFSLEALSFALEVPRPRTASLPFNKVGMRVEGLLTFCEDTGVVNARLQSNVISYQAIIKVGTPAREALVSIDTGSSDLWIKPSIFDPYESSTWEDCSQGFEVEYLDGSRANGKLGKDTVEIAGAVLEQAEFASADGTTTNNGDGVLGVGYSIQDSGNYPNIPVELKNQGFTESVSYSLWLNDSNSESDGSVLFGGLDHSLYEGDMTIVPIIVAPTAPDHFKRENVPINMTTVLNEISMSNGNGEKQVIIGGAALPVQIDSGSTFCELPKDFVDMIVGSIPGIESTTDDANEIIYYTDFLPEGSVWFNILGAEIEVPLLGFFKVNGSYYQLGCYVAADSEELNLEEQVFILGDSFLSSAYVVFDLENNEIGLAQARIGDTMESDIEVIDAEGIPGVNASKYFDTQVHTEYSARTATIFNRDRAQNW